MTKEQITAMLATRKDAHHLVQKRLVLDGILMTCLNCEFYDATKKHACTQFDATPPPETLVYSCVTHWIQEVPF
jgi:hypothetical protein